MHESLLANEVKEPDQHTHIRVRAYDFLISHMFGCCSDSPTPPRNAYIVASRIIWIDRLVCRPRRDRLSAVVCVNNTSRIQSQAGRPRCSGDVISISFTRSVVSILTGTGCTYRCCVAQSLSLSPFRALCSCARLLHRRSDADFTISSTHASNHTHAAIIQLVFRFRS